MGTMGQFRSIARGFLMTLAIAIGAFAPIQAAGPQAYAAGTTNGHLAGKVTGFQGALVQAGAKVSVTDGRKVWTAQTKAANGAYTLELPAGSYTVTVTAANYTSKSFTKVKVESKKNTKLNASLVWSYGKLAGTIKTASGQALKDAKVQVKSGDKTIASYDTNRNGSYALDLLPGTYTITVSAKNYTSIMWSNIKIKGNKLTTLDASLALKIGTLEGKVTDTGSKTLKDVNVTITGSGQSVQVITDSNGAYQASLPAGSYKVQFEAADYSTESTANIKVEANQTTTLDVQLVSVYGTVTGKVTNNNNDPIANAKVSISGLGISVTTDKDGKYTVPAVKAGEYTIDISFDKLNWTGTVLIKGGAAVTVNAKLAPPKDTAAPVTTATLTPVKSDDGHIRELQVTLQATDAKSGVDVTEYRIYTSKGWDQWLKYTGAFTVSAGSTYAIQYRSIDKTHNEEKAHTIDFNNCGCKN